MKSQKGLSGVLFISLSRVMLSVMLILVDQANTNQTAQYGSGAFVPVHLGQSTHPISCSWQKALSPHLTDLDDERIPLGVVGGRV